MSKLTNSQEFKIKLQHMKNNLNAQHIQQQKIDKMQNSFEDKIKDLTLKKQEAIGRLHIQNKSFQQNNQQVFDEFRSSISQLSEHSSSQKYISPPNKYVKSQISTHIEVKQKKKQDVNPITIEDIQKQVKHQQQISQNEYMPIIFFKQSHAVKQDMYKANQARKMSEIEQKENLKYLSKQIDSKFIKNIETDYIANVNKTYHSVTKYLQEQENIKKDEQNALNSNL